LSNHNCAHHHHSPHAPGSGSRAFAIGAALNAAFVIVEAGCGFYSGSLALVADAGHNLSDVLGLLLAWGANYLSSRRPTTRRTYGWGRSSIMAAVFNGLLLLVAVGAIAWEGIGRLLHPRDVSPWPVIAVAGIGFVINTLTALLFFSGQKHDLNVRGAFLHMAADAAVSLGVVVSGLVFYFTGWQWIDPAVSIVIAVVISTWDLLWQALELALDSVPRGIEPDEVRAFLTALPGITAVHDLHIWGMSTTQTALTVHLVRPAATIDDDWLHDVAHELQDRFGIVHSTIQVESGAGNRSCRQEPEDVV
jgi:cobalt-zinc-cadmium efflux system protein